MYNKNIKDISMEINAINPFAKKIGGVQGVNQFQPVSPVKKAGADGGNPFNFGDDGKVGLGIKDGATQVSNGQMGKKIGQMRQLGIA